MMHEDSRLLGSQPNSPLDRSQFQLAPKQSQVEQQFVFTQRQPRVYTHSVLALLCHCLLNHTGALPSNRRSKYIRLSSSVFSRFFSLSLRSRVPFFHFLACLQALAPLQHSPSPPGPWCCVIRMEGKGGRTPLAELAFRGFRYLNPIFFRVARRPCTLL